MLSVIVGLGIAIGIILYLLNLSQASSTAIDSIVNTITALMSDTFRFIVLLTPLIITVTPLYILRERKTKDIVLGFIYGIILLLLLNKLGLINAVYVYFGLTNAYWLSYLPFQNIASAISFGLNIFNTGILFWKTDKNVFKRIWKVIK